MRVLKRLKEATNKLIFCYSETENFSSFIKLVWFTKLYRFTKKKIKYEKYHNKFFSISLIAFPNRKIFLRIYAGDIDIFYEIFYKKIYDLPASLNNKLIVDAGANVGFASLFFLYKMPNATIYCIEPDADNFIFLKKNLRNEIKKEKIIALQSALADKDGFAYLRSGHFKYNSSITNNGNEDTVEVVAYNVSSFFKKIDIEKIDLFKMDIEGAEENIFKADTFWLREVSELLIEFHSKEIKKNCFEKLEKEKFKVSLHPARLNTEVFHFIK